MAVLGLLGGLASPAGLAGAVARNGEPGGAAPQHMVRNWHIEDGLPDASITAIAQTPDGFLWLGTPRGLVRFDGLQFKWLATNQTSGLPDAPVSALWADRAGSLWIAGSTRTLARLDRGGLHDVGLPDAMLRTADAAPSDYDAGGTRRSTRWMWGRGGGLAEDSVGGVWLALPGRELLANGSGASGAFHPVPGLPAGEIGTLIADEADHIWIAIGDSLHRYRDGRWESPAAARSLGGPLPVLARARGGGVWVAAAQGSWVTGGGRVRRFKAGAWSEGFDPTPWTPNSLRSQVTALLEDRGGRLWLGTLWGGVYCSDASGRWHGVQRESPLSQCVITCLFEDRQGAVWVGTVGEGLHRVTQRPVERLTLPPPADESIVTASCGTWDGSHWAGTDGAGAFRYWGGRFQAYGLAEGLTNLHVCTIIEDRQTNLWLGTWGGLFRFQRGHFARVEGPVELELPVLALYEDRAGDLWIGTPRGLVRHRGTEFAVYRLEDAGGEWDIRSLAEDTSGGLWVGTIGRGLFRWSQGRVERYGPEQGFPCPNARSLYCDPAGELWIGTGGAGLVRRRDGQFIAYTTADGLPGDTISSIDVDAEGYLWMGSDNGIFACAPAWFEAYRRGRSPALVGPRLSVADGLGSRGCSGSGQPVTSRSADGRLWFPNMRGLAVFDPRQVTARSGAPEVFIEAVVVDGVERSPSATGDYRVPTSARRLAFHYTAPDLRSPQSLRFRHKLEGMDEDWVDAGTRRVAYYSQLPPGRYRFRAMAGGGDGRWYEGATPVALRVVPRLWELRSVQVAGVVLVVGGLIGGAAWFSHRRIELQLERLRMQQALENERRRIARDLHDDVGARLTEIVLQGELAKRAGSQPGVLQTHIDRITRQVRQLVTAMEEVVWTVNPNNDSLPGLAAYLSDYTERFLAPTGIACRLDVGADLPPLPLSAQVRHNLLLAVKEALNNAARHAAAQTVQLEIRLDQSQLRVSIQDDGRGFNPESPGRSGNGLANLRSRLEAVGGCTSIASAPGEGTTVAFTLPLRGSES